MGSTNVCAHYSHYKANNDDFFGVDDCFGIIQCGTTFISSYAMRHHLSFARLLQLFKLSVSSFSLENPIFRLSSSQSKRCSIVTHLKSLISGASSSFPFFPAMRHFKISIFRSFEFLFLASIFFHKVAIKIESEEFCAIHPLQTGFALLNVKFRQQIFRKR